MPAMPAIALAITAASTIYGAVDQNQQRQHAKGAAEAEQTALNDQVKKSGELDTATRRAKATNASATQAAALAAVRASMSSTNLLGGSVLTGGSGAAPAPTASKQLLGA